MKRFAFATAGALVALSLLAAPAAAHASTIYPPAGSCTVSPTTIRAGESFTLACAADTFGPNERITITITGENGADATVPDTGMVRFAISTASGSARSSAAGALDGVSITLPANATGNYNIAAVSPTSAGGTVAATITGADGELSSTGMDSATTLGLWIGGGALLLAGATLAIVAAVRRRRDRD